MRALAALTVTLGMAMALSASARAEEEEQKNFVCRPEVYDRLTKAQEAFNAKKYDTALQEAEKARKRMRLNKHETALVLQTIGYIYAGKEQLKESAQSLEGALEQQALPKQTEASIRYTLGQIYLATKEFEKSVKAFDAWMASVENPNASALYTIAVAKFQAKRYADSVQYAEWAIRETKKPADSWLQLLLSGYYETKRYPKAVGILIELIDRHPDRRSQWLQLSALYSQLGEEDKALGVLEMAYRAGLVDRHEELVNLAQRYLHREIPAKAGRLLEEGMASGKIRKDADSLRMLATAWFQARELTKAAPVMSEAAALATDGELYARLAQIYVEREQFNEAIKAGQKALDKGKLKSPGQVYLLMGVAQHRLGNNERARSLFARAAEQPSTKSSAQGWLKYLASVGGTAAEAGE
jgi:tetratricopeptide (TPR) repeat protein